MPDEYNCDYCGVSYKNEDSVLTCVDCETTWCAVCTEDVFCPHCAAKNDTNCLDLVMFQADPDKVLKDCPQCNDTVATWKHSENFQTHPGYADRVTCVVCMICGYCHETTTQQIKEN